ncbi:MAG: type I polyketide synthase [Thermoleophilaceae bacterium]
MPRSAVTDPKLRSSRSTSMACGIPAASLLERSRCRERWPWHVSRVILNRPARRTGRRRLQSRRAEIEGWLARSVATRTGTPVEVIDVDSPFELFGLDSHGAVEISGELAVMLGRDLPDTLLYDHPTIGRLTDHLVGDEHRAGRARRQGGFELTPIAVVGMSCRFPGGADHEAFWELLDRGGDAVSAEPPDGFLDALDGIPDQGVQYGGFLGDIDEFDPLAFGIAPSEAARMDPQQRLMLEVAWEALEDAAATAQLDSVPTGVYVGVSTSDYGQRELTDPAGVDSRSSTGSALSVVANRISYALDLHGPSLSVDTACSSSLVAIHLACQALLTGECEQAVAGGVNVMLNPVTTLGLARLGLLSPSGRCRAFDAAADGFVRGEGAGAVVLKRLDAAVADGDRILALIRGSAVNSDGRTNGLTAPSRGAQEAVLREAYRRAGIQPSSVDYVEAQGTGTLLGDTIEAGALGSVLAEGRPLDRPCTVGSVKTNIGHLEAAAGVAAFIKVVLALQRRTIPASLHFAEPNPGIPFDRLPLRIGTATQPWKNGGEPRRAGVSAFGFGGTNAHLVLEEADAG